MYINGNKLNVRRFSSGELKFLKSELDKFIVNNRVEILYVNEYSFFELMLVIKYYCGKDVLVDLVMGYLPYQRMDHKNRDELDTVNYVANIINELKLDSLTICEPHCKIDCFNDCKSFSYIGSMKNFVFKDVNFDENKDIVVLADKGGVERYKNIFNKVIYFNKVRDEDSGLIIKHEIVGGFNVCGKVVIVDDIISTGDTIVNIIEELINHNVKEIYIMSGHFENNKYNKRIFEYNEVRKVYSTNSLKKKGSKKLKLFDVKNLYKV